MWRDPVGRVRVIGKLEALSFLALLGVAMPLKYAADMPLAVSIVGFLHGVLFMGLCYVTLMAKSELDWPLKRAALIVIAALLPFGPFVIDRRLEHEQQSRA